MTVRNDDYTTTQVLTSKLLPLLVCDDLEPWIKFFRGYGLTTDQILSLVRMLDPDLLQKSSPFTVGQNIMLAKTRMGFTDADLVSRILPCYPSLLFANTDTLEARLDRLEKVGLTNSLTDATQGRLDRLEKVGLTNSLTDATQQFPVLMMDGIHEELLTIMERVNQSRDGKYQNSGSYHL
eukprot:gene1714-33121_t